MIKLRNFKIPKWYERSKADKSLCYALNSSNDFAKVYINSGLYREIWIRDGKRDTAHLLHYSSNHIIIYDDETLQPLTE
ncbi:unnamed protein product [Adineta steineri]|uniref:Uncharacterized protein n=1 Tax=Adineta steineri TaxID=433720 RepID=A0A814S1J9_9BILA|nr:unnamed protein product [Adineta steineri]CAF3677635.1 unnamed protein product [Adineta steineri]